MADASRKRPPAGERTPPVPPAASLDSVASAMSGHTSQAAPALPALMTELATLFARASDTDSAVIAALTVLRRVLGASELRVELQYEESLRSVLSDRGMRGPAAPDFSEDLVVPIVAAGESLGRLVVDLGHAVDDQAEMLCMMTAALVATAASRDLRMRHLELEVSSQMRQVAEQRRFTEQVVDSLPFGVYVVDRDYRIHAWNQKREIQMQGVTRDEVIGRTIFDVLSRQPAALLKQEFDDVFSTGRMQQFQMESSATGERRTFRISKIPMSLDHDDVTHVITVGEDITEWRAAVDRIAQSEKLAALGQLAAGVMHEVNNPLATIAACAESLALQFDPPSATTSDLLRIIDLEVQRCKRIVDGLLDFSRPKPASRQVVDLNEVLRQAMFLMHHHPRYKRFEVHVEADEAPHFVEGSADQLVQVVIALAMNAFDATPDGKRVTFRTGRSTNATPSAFIEVADEGPGISHSVAARMFEPFFTTKPQGQGTGLGLSICYGIVADHGGSFELLQPDVPGATFRMTLPLVQPHADGHVVVDS